MMNYSRFNPSIRTLLIIHGIAMSLFLMSCAKEQVQIVAEDPEFIKLSEKHYQHQVDLIKVAPRIIVKEDYEFLIDPVTETKFNDAMDKILQLEEESMNYSMLLTLITPNQSK